MGTCNSFNESENSNEEYININANNNSNAIQRQRRPRLLSDPTSDYTYNQNCNPYEGIRTMRIIVIKFI